MKSDDLISRAEAIDIIRSMTISLGGKEIFHPEAKKSVLGALDEIAAIDAEPVRHGYWIPQDNTHTKFMCSDCKGRNHDGSGKYCSECGCKMDGEVEG